MYEYPVTIEFEDIDNYGIVHHPKFLYYCERVRVHFFHDNGIDLKALPYGVVLRNLTVNFKTPLVLLDKIVIGLATKNIDKYRFDFEYFIKKDGKLCASANIEMVTIDLETKRLFKIPDDMLKLLETIKID
jgi:acyl-CoA thioester hydrolase